MEMFALIGLLKRQTSPLAGDIYAEDAFYQSHARRRGTLSRLAPLAAIVGVLAVAIDMWSR